MLSAAAYVEGQVINLEVVVTAFHQGRFAFRICKIAGRGDPAGERRQLTEDCLDQNHLVRAAGWLAGLILSAMDC